MIDLSKGYRNAVFDPFTRNMIVWGWDQDNNRVKQAEPYKPYLYVETTSDNADAKSIFGSNLRKIEFSSNKNRKDFIDRHPTGRVFHALSTEQQFLVDNCRQYTTEQLTQNPTRIFFLDIEVHSPKEFPHANQAKHPVNVITIYDSLTQQFHTWGIKKFDKERLVKIMTEQGIAALDLSKLKYTACRDEHELFERFLKFWTNNFPDVVSGWNSVGFDVPYIVNRLDNLFGPDTAKILSPVQRIFVREGVVNIFGKLTTNTLITGISSVDYMELYRTFSRGDSESYKLGDVAAKELKVTKIKHGAGDLVTLADSDWDMFVAYNIQDVNLLVMMEDTLRYLNIARFVATTGFAKVESAMGKVAIVSGAMAAQALNKDKILPTFRNSLTVRDEYAGGYVRDPVKGLHTDVVSYDANSLYPNVIITLNISPECKVGKIISTPSPDVIGSNTEEDVYVIRDPNNNTKRLTPYQFGQLLSKGKCTVSSANVVYSQLRKGIIPEFIDSLYTRRVDCRKQLAAAEKQLALLTEGTAEHQQLDLKIGQLDAVQYTIKILLNSIYGNFANLHSPLFDIDAASSITMTGQDVIKQAGVIANDWARVRFDNPELDIVSYGDTDSCYLTMENCCRLLNDGKLTQQGAEVVAELDRQMNTEISKWAQTALFTSDSRLVFKRETICQAALFLEKKRYILDVRYQEDTPINKLKFTGVEIARSSLSESVKDTIRQIVSKLFSTLDQRTVIDFYYQKLGEYMHIPIDDLSKRSKLGSFDKYAPHSTGLSVMKRTPHVVAGAIAHNWLIEQNGLAAVYPKLEQGSKVKFVSLQKNPYRLKGIAYGEQFPVELGLLPDYHTMFQKMVNAPLRRIFNALQWQLPTGTYIPYTTLQNAFS